MTLVMMIFKVPLDVSASGLHILHSNGSLEVWPGEAGDHVYQCRVTLGEVGSLLSTPATLRSPGEKIVLNCETGKIRLDCKTGKMYLDCETGKIHVDCDTGPDGRVWTQTHNW